jgi:hypothetical protein
LCLTAGGLALPARLNVSAASQPAPVNLDLGGPQQATVACQQSTSASIEAPNYPTKGCGTGPGYCQQYGGSGAYPAYGYDNVWACSPSLSIDNTPFDVNDGNSFQCVDLSARFLWAVDGQWAGQGVSYYGQNLVADVYNEYFPDLSEGTTAGNNVPTPGDVISFGPGAAVAPGGVGHTAVVVASDPASRTFTIMSENMTNVDSDGTAGVQYLQTVPGTGSQVTRTTTNSQGQTVQYTSVTHEGTVRFVDFGGATAQAEWLDEANPATVAASPTPTVRALQITTPNTATSPPNATVGKPYGENLEASGPGDEASLYQKAGEQLYVWSIASGSLPQGLSLSSNGTIAGTPTAVSQGGPFTVEVKAEGQTAEQPFTIWANAPPIPKSTLTITTPSTVASPSNGTKGKQYSFNFTASGGKGDYRWSLASGSLPAGLSLSKSGLVSGTPTKVTMGGAFTIKVTSADATADGAFTIWALSQNQLEILTPSNSSSLPSATVGRRYSYVLVATGGTGNYAWSMAGTGAPGIKLSSRGVVSGTFAKAGSRSFTAKVTSGRESVTKVLTVQSVGIVFPNVSAEQPCNLLSQGQVADLFGPAANSAAPAVSGSNYYDQGLEFGCVWTDPTGGSLDLQASSGSSVSFIQSGLANCPSYQVESGVGTYAVYCPPNSEGDSYFSALEDGWGINLLSIETTPSPAATTMASVMRALLVELGG